MLPSHNAMTAQAKHVVENVRNMGLPMVLLLLQWHPEQLESRTPHSDSQVKGQRWYHSSYKLNIIFKNYYKYTFLS